jgi:hypothetical protein
VNAYRPSRPWFTGRMPVPLPGNWFRETGSEPITEGGVPTALRGAASEPLASAFGTGSSEIDEQVVSPEEYLDSYPLGLIPSREYNRVN